MSYAGDFLKLWRTGVLGLTRPDFIAQLKSGASLDLNRLTNIEAGKILFRPEYLNDLVVFPEFDSFTRRWLQIYIREDMVDRFRAQLPRDLPRLEVSVPVAEVIRTIVTKSYDALRYKIQDEIDWQRAKEDGHRPGRVYLDERPLNSIELRIYREEIQMQMGRIEAIDPLGGTKTEVAIKTRKAVLDMKLKVLRPPFISLWALETLLGTFFHLSYSSYGLDVPDVIALQPKVNKGDSEPDEDLTPYGI